MDLMVQLTVLAIVILSFVSFQTEGKARECSKIPLKFLNGKYRVTPRTTDRNRPFPIGTRVYYKCDKGFKRVGVKRITCIRGGWSRDPPKCIAESCDDPGNIRHARINVIEVGIYVKINCEPGYELHGDNFMRCQENGKWSKKPKCIDPLRSAAQTLKEEFVDKLGLVTTDSKGRAGLSGGAAGLDLVFVLDNSGSLGESNFEKGKSFVKEMVKSFGVSRHELGTRIAVVPFDEEASVVIELNDETLNSTETATEKIDSQVKYTAGGTHTKAALLKVANEVVPTTRKLSKKALFLITDGESNRDQAPGDMAHFLRVRYEFEIFAVGITKDANRNELLSVASEPFRSHVFMLKNYDDLSLLAQMINGSKTDYSECGIAGDTQSRINASVGRIVGGNNARAGAWPWQAIILVNRVFRCGGALLDENWVVTAAHCFHNDQPSAFELDVILGEHNRKNEEGSEQREFVSKIIIHPDNVRYGLDFDIALLKLESPVKLTAYVRPVCLPVPVIDDGLAVAGKPAMITGWGAITKVGIFENPGPTVFILQQARVPLADQGDCMRSSAANLPVTENMICAGKADGKIDACKGDSGGPLVARKSSDEWVLLGLVSWGEGCALEGKYGIYTRVLKFVDWMGRIMVIE